MMGHSAPLFVRRGRAGKPLLLSSLVALGWEVVLGFCKSLLCGPCFSEGPPVLPQFAQGREHKGFWASLLPSAAQMGCSLCPG